MIRVRTLMISAAAAGLAAGAASWAEPPPASAPRSSGAVESFSDPSQSGPAEGAQAARSADAPAPTDRPRPPRRPRKRRVPPPAAAPAATAASAPPSAPDPVPEWRPADPDNTLVIDTNRGVVIVALAPAAAPQSVERVKRLTRLGIYDGLLFHRVIDGFVAQTGNPNNHDGGKSAEPNLPPEFTFRLGADMPHAVAARPAGDATGLLQTLPYESVAEERMAGSPDHRITAWGAFCAGVMGMGRDATPDSGNSEIFFMRDPARRLDRSYSPVGRILSGLEIIRSLAVGEPPATPDRMVRVRVLADIPAPERPTVEVVDTAGPAFRAVIERTRSQRGADFSVCDLEVPARVTPPPPTPPPITTP